jgi:hypothetical protein
VSPVKYELGFYIPGDDILHIHSHVNSKSYITLMGMRQQIAYSQNATKPIQNIPDDQKCAPVCD